MPAVKAEDFFVEEENGLSKEWFGRIWLNPPYHRDLAPKFIEKLVQEYLAGRTTAAILLTNNCTDTEWFEVAVRAASSVCFSHGRIHFFDGRASPPVMMDAPPQGQAFFYFGLDPQRFEDEFYAIGSCLRLSRRYEKTPARASS